MSSSASAVSLRRFMLQCNRTKERPGASADNHVFQAYLVRAAMQNQMPDKPWIFRTYAGHSTAADSNVLYRKNLAKGQTGLSVAFDLPTQTGYDSDHPLAGGEVGKVGVPICHLGDMRA